MKDRSLLQYWDRQERPKPPCELPIPAPSIQGPTSSHNGFSNHYREQRNPLSVDLQPLPSFNYRPEHQVNTKNNTDYNVDDITRIMVYTTKKLFLRLQEKNRFESVHPTSIPVTHERNGNPRLRRSRRSLVYTQSSRPREWDSNQLERDIPSDDDRGQSTLRSIVRYYRRRNSKDQTWFETTTIKHKNLHRTMSPFLRRTLLPLGLWTQDKERHSH